MRYLLIPSLLLLTACTQVEITNVRLARYQGDCQAAVSFTFDDGMLCQYTDVAPALEQNGLRGTFWIIGANMDRDEPDYPWMTWEQVAELAQRGHEMSNHSLTHPDLTKLTDEELLREVAQNDSVIEAHTGIRPRTFCYPYNAFNEHVVSICSQGRVGTRTFQEAQGQEQSHQTAETLRAWLDQIIDQGEWGVTMTHGTTYGWDMWHDPQLLYDFFAEAATRQDSLWIAPFARVSAYISERDDVDISWTKGTRCIVITPTLSSLDPTLFDEPLTFLIEGNFGHVSHVAALQGSDGCTVINRSDHLLVNAVPNGEEVVIKW